MADLFNVPIAKILGDAMGPLMLAATLVKRTAGTRTSGALTGGTNPTETSYGARGFIDDYKDYLVDGTLIQRGDRKVTLLGATIASGAVPEADDRVTIEGRTWNIKNVARDPVAATYECQVRR